MRWLIPLLFALWAPTAAADAVSELESMLAGLGGLQGEFEQQVMDRDERELERSSGEFRLLQPGYFFWHIQSPDEQLLYATDNTLWHYDVELETATRRDIAAELSQSPLAVFSGQAGSVEALYHVEQSEGSGFTLVPRSEDAGFVSIRLSFSGGLPSAMWVVDRLEQTTYIRFHHVAPNDALTPASFVFTPPDGVDVYYHDR